MPGLFSNASIATKLIRIGNEDLEISFVGDLDLILETKSEKELTKTCPFGGVIWPSSIALCRWLAQKIETKSKFETDSSAAFFNELKSAIESERSEILELGCGVGLASLYMSKRLNRRALLTDFEDSLETIVRKNAVSFGVEKVCRFATLDWNVSQVPKSISDRNVSVIVAADVLYEHVHIELVPTIAAKIMKATGAELFILADPERYCYATALAKLKDTFAEVGLFTVQEGVLETGEQNQSAHSQGRVHFHFCKKPR